MSKAKKSWVRRIVESIFGSCRLFVLLDEDGDDMNLDLGQSPTTPDFLPQYKAIGQSLKKRLFRKPNVAEAIEQYESLSAELGREDQKKFAAICIMEAAKCQESLKAPIPQGNSLAKAAKLFLDAWESEKLFGSREKSVSGNYELGLQTLSQAGKCFMSMGYNALGMLTHKQAGDLLSEEGLYGEALCEYKAALREAKQHFSFIDQLDLIQLVVGGKIKLLQHESALKTVSATLIAIRNFENDNLDYELEILDGFTQKFEISRVLLSLIVIGPQVDMLDAIFPKAPIPGFDDQKIWEGSSPDQIVGWGTSVGLWGIEGGEQLVGTERNLMELEYLLKSYVLALQKDSRKEINAARDKLIPRCNQSHMELFRFYDLIQI